MYTGSTVVYLTKLFATYEVEDICSRVGEDVTAMALTTLNCYMETNGNRNQSADALKVNLHSLSEKVLSEYFIYGNDD